MAQRTRTAAATTATADPRDPLLPPSPAPGPGPSTGPAAPPSTSSEPTDTNTTNPDAPLTPSSSPTSSSTSSGISLHPHSPPRPLIEGKSFTARAILVGLGVGLIICFSNMYFGLQTGWVSIMSMPASLMGFGVFRLLTKRLKFPFSPVENVLVQTVAGSMAIMPLGCGFVGVIPAMQFLLRDDEGGGPGLDLGLGKLVVWGLGLCYFGVVFGVPLRRQVIIREQLKFPSGFSTAVLISVLHGKTRQRASESERHEDPATFASLAAQEELGSAVVVPGPGNDNNASAGGQETGEEEAAEPHSASWKRNLNLLLVCFLLSGIFTLSTYFVPSLRSIPIFGSYLATTWLWTLNPSLAYVGQGIIMGPATTLHMLLGAVIGWGVLSPLAKSRGWAPGDVDDWEKGSKGWIVWVSLAIMLADSVVSLGWLAGRSVVRVQGVRKAVKWVVVQGHGIVQRAKEALGRADKTKRPVGRSGYRTISTGDAARGGVPTRPRLGRRLSDISEASNSDDDEEDYTHLNSGFNGGLRQRHSSALNRIHEEDLEEEKEEEYDDAPPDQQVSDKTVAIGLVLSIVFCIGCIHFVFGSLVPLFATVTAVFMALVLSVMGVRALGETDLNPVSGISKLAQLFFAFIIPQSNKNSVLINLVAGAVSEAGALQAGDLMQDLKTGHLLGAAPKAQFYGQVIGATVGAIVSAFIYKLYTVVYTIPGPLFQVPTGYVWIFTARLVTGEGLPPMAKEWAIGSATLFAATTAARIVIVDKLGGGGVNGEKAKRWQALIPGGIAVAVGMYNVPSFTIARTIGGLLGWWWKGVMGWEDTPLIVLASGFILGEGFLSIVNLILQSAGVPHL
ncbi:oligonucleotide transporter [Pseudoneurospora amorphoporcata]|uniref:Oligonucleotide transporter n=1 Tax=Pseudoneurospora amorphoporcata TaxID=241081 RepID=A0AAN6SGV2_9PEZI|nr:oligonucleotide transporter [Pseudoneurospora amorphoporcata]